MATQRTREAPGCCAMKHPLQTGEMAEEKEEGGWEDEKKKEQVI